MDVVTLAAAKAAASRKYAQTSAGLYVPAGWGTFYKAKRNAAGSGQCVIAAKGDSVTQGLWSSSLRNKSWVGLCAAALQTQYGDGGSGFFIGQRSTLNATMTTAGYATQTELVAFSGASWAVFNNLGGAGDGGIRCAASPATTHTLTFQVRGNTVQVFHLTGSGNGSFSWTVDGVSQGTVSTNAATGASVVSATGFGGGVHTVVLTVAIGQAAVYINGVRGTNATGVIVDNYSISGETSAAAAVSNFGSAPAWTGGANNPCDLLIYSEGLNDAFGSVAVDTFVSNVTTFLRTVRDGTGTAPKNGATDILIVVQHVGKHDTSVPTFYPQYVSRLYTLAQTYGAAVVNMWAQYQTSYAAANAVNYWGSGTSSGAAGADNVHPSDAGHQLIADAVLPILTAA